MASQLRRQDDCKEETDEDKYQVVLFFQEGEVELHVWYIIELFKILAHDNILEYILNPPIERFVFCITKSHKKQLAYKSIINNCNQKFIVTTDFGNISIEHGKVIECYPIIQNWYSYIDSNKSERTYFTKDEIKCGCKILKKIQDYGYEKYFEENKKLEKYRGSSWMNLLIFALNTR